MVTIAMLEPGGTPRAAEVGLDVKDWQALVGGYFEVYPLGRLLLVCNEGEPKPYSYPWLSSSRAAWGPAHGLEPCFLYEPPASTAGSATMFYGVVLVTKANADGDFVSLTADEMAAALALLAEHAA